MGRKSRVKREKKEHKIQDVITRRVEAETGQFLGTHGLAVGSEAEEKGSKLVHLVGVMVNFTIYRYIKSGIQLPTVNQAEEAKDEDRLRNLNAALEQLSTELGLAPHEVSELITRLTSDDDLVNQVMEKIYDMLESMVGSETFGEMTDGQIENPDTWGDSLTDYESLEAAYFEALKEVFLLNLKIVRAGGDGSDSGPDLEDELKRIKEKHRLPDDAVDKLSRRGTEFLRVAFANYLEMDFQPVRERLDGKGAHSTRETAPLQ